MIEAKSQKVITLEKNQELRIEVSSKEIHIKLLSGSAEIFGSELAKDLAYLFKNAKFAIFSWHGCQIEVSGDCATDYVAGDTPMHTYLNSHIALEGLRAQAAVDKEYGPKVMILGGPDVGKTALAKILINYAVKVERKPLFIDLDTNEGSVSLPGVISATAFSHPINPEEGFGSTPLTTNLSSFCLYYGFSNCLEKPIAYGVLLKKLAEITRKRCEKDEATKTSGFIINTPSVFSESSGYETLIQVVTDFKVDALFVIGHERLYSDLKKKYADTKGMHIIKLEKSGGVVNKDIKFRKDAQYARIREYFYGTPTLSNRADLNPFSNIVKFTDISIRRIGDSSLAPSSALPLGTDRKARETKLVKVAPGDILLHSVLALSNYAEPAATDVVVGAAVVPPAVGVVEDESKMLLESNIAGFIYVSEVNEAKGVMTVLSPSPGKLPRRYLMMGALKWIETS